MSTGVSGAQLRAHEAAISWNRDDWTRLVTRSRLPMLQRLVALTVAVYAGEDGRQGAWLSYPDVGQMSGLMSAPAARHHLDQLRAAGWLAREDKNGPWMLAWPAQLPARSR